MLNVGDTYEEELIITPEQERIFTELTGDYNPIHINVEAANQVGFPAPIVHGMLAASMIATVIGQFVGAGTINMERSFQFVRPLFVNVQYTMHFKVSDIDREAFIGTIKCRVKNNDNKICLVCSTLVKNTEQFGY